MIDVNKLILLGLVLAFSVNAEQKYNAEGYPVDDEGYVIMDSSSANDAYNDPGYKPSKWVPGAEYVHQGRGETAVDRASKRKHEQALERARRPVVNIPPPIVIVH